MEGIVESVEESVKACEGYTLWWSVKLKDGDVFRLHRNWFDLHGSLKAGDKVEYEKGPEDMFNKLRKIEKKSRAEKWKKLR